MRRRWRLVVFVLGFLAGLLFVQKLEGQEMSCRIASVQWSDTVIRVKVKGIIPDPDLLVPVLSFGCVRETETAVVVIHSFTDGQPDDFLAIPKSWTVKITPLHAKETHEKEANLQSGSEKKTPALAVQVKRAKAKTAPPVPKVR